MLRNTIDAGRKMHPLTDVKATILKKKFKSCIQDVSLQEDVEDSFEEARVNKVPQSLT